MNAFALAVFASLSLVDLASGSLVALAFMGALVATLNLLVGAFVGDAVGALVGALVGAFVGFLVGAFVGNAVGVAVGASVGDAVGDSVMRTGGSFGSPMLMLELIDMLKLIDCACE